MKPEDRVDVEGRTDNTPSSSAAQKGHGDAALSLGMLVVQLLSEKKERRVALVSEDGSRLQTVRDAESLYQIAMEAIEKRTGIIELIKAKGIEAEEEYEAVMSSNRLLLPFDSPDPSRSFITGTGLTHRGSASGRDAMHRENKADTDSMTDSMRIFQQGLAEGKPQKGQVGIQPEWFYKGNGRMAVRSGDDLQMPAFAMDGGEEPELVGIYIICPGGQPWRVGFCLGNEFSDHVMEKGNYLNLAHSKLRPCAYGPEILIGGEPPRDIRGYAKILRNGKELWHREFLTGEDNMTHSFANLEHHHFKYEVFRSPGDVHLHFYGTSTLSFSDGIRTEPGDIFEIWAPPFTRSLKNRLTVAEDSGIATVKAL